MKYILIALCFTVSACSSLPMRDCKALCQSDKVDLYKDESTTCKCRGCKDE